MDRSRIQKRYQSIHRNFRKAMSAPAAFPEFRGNLVAVETFPFWDMPLTKI